MTRGKRPARSWGWIFAPGAILRRSRRRPCPRAVPPAASLPRACPVASPSVPALDPATVQPRDRYAVPRRVPAPSLPRPSVQPLDTSPRPFARYGRPPTPTSGRFPRRPRKRLYKRAIAGYCASSLLYSRAARPCVPSSCAEIGRRGFFLPSTLAPVCRIWYHSRVPLLGLAR